MTVRDIFEFFAAAVGTAAFALLFQVPHKYFLACGTIGGCGWVLYKFMLQFMSSPLAAFLGIILVVLLARIASFRMQCPATIFLIAGIFPLVPGAGIYWTAYYIVMDDMILAGEQGMNTLKTAIAIALGILAVFEIPSRWFRVFSVKKGN